MATSLISKAGAALLKKGVSKLTEKEAKSLIGSMDNRLVQFQGKNLNRNDVIAINKARRALLKNKGILSEMNLKYPGVFSGKGPVQAAVNKAVGKKTDLDKGNLKAAQAAAAERKADVKSKFPLTLGEINRRAARKKTFQQGPLTKTQEAAMKAGKGIGSKGQVVDVRSRGQKVGQAVTDAAKTQGQFLKNVANLPGKVVNLITGKSGKVKTNVKNLSEKDALTIAKNDAIRKLKGRAVPIVGARKAQKAAFLKLINSVDSLKDLKVLREIAAKDPIMKRIVNDNKSKFKRFMLKGQKLAVGVSGFALLEAVLNPRKVAKADLTTEEKLVRDTKRNVSSVSKPRKVNNRKAPIVKLSDIKKAGITGGTASQRLTAFMNMYEYDAEKGRYVKRKRNLVSRVKGVNEIMANAKRG